MSSALFLQDILITPTLYSSKIIEYKAKIDEDDQYFMEALIQEISLLLTNPSIDLNIRFSSLKFLKDLMDFDCLLLAKLVKEKLLVKAMRLANPKHKFEAPLDPSLSQLAIECIYVWSRSRLYGDLFLEGYECLLSQGVQFPKHLSYFQNNCGQTVFERNPKIRLCTTQIMNISNNNDISFFIVENKMETIKELLEKSNNPENCDLKQLKKIRNDFDEFLNKRADDLMNGDTFTMNSSKNNNKLQHIKKIVESLKKFIELFDKFSQKLISYKEFCSSFQFLKKSLNLEKGFDQTIFNEIFKDLLETPNNYKINEKKYLDKINFNEDLMLNIIITCDLVILDNSFNSSQRVLALKFLKNAMDLRNQRFVRFFQIHALETFYQIALFNGEANKENKSGELFFSETPDLEQQKNGIFFVMMVLECLVNWANWFQGDFKHCYEELLKHGVRFPENWNHFIDFTVLKQKFNEVTNYIERILECKNKPPEQIVLYLNNLNHEISDFCVSIRFSELKLKACSILMLPDEKTFYRNFIDGIEMLYQFLNDFEAINTKEKVLEMFIDEYSRVNTFRKCLESIRKNENLEKIEDVIKRAVDSEEDFEENYIKIVEEVMRNDSANIDKIINNIYIILRNLSSSPLQCFLSLKILKECMETKNCYFIEQVSNKILDNIYDSAKSYQDLDYNLESGKIEYQYARIAIESLMKWAQWFPTNVQGNQSEFENKLNLLISNNIKLPDSFQFYSLSNQDKSLMNQIKDDFMRLSAKMVASKKISYQDIISEEQVSENSKDDESIESSRIIPKDKSVLQKPISTGFKNCFVGFSPEVTDKFIIKTPDKEQLYAIRQANGEKNQSNNEISFNSEFSSKSFKSIIEKNSVPNEKINIKTSFTRRKTSHFGNNHNFLSGMKPKIIRKDTGIPLFSELEDQDSLHLQENQRLFSLLQLAQTSESNLLSKYNALQSDYGALKKQFQELQSKFESKEEEIKEIILRNQQEIEEYQSNLSLCKKEIEILTTKTIIQSSTIIKTEPNNRRSSTENIDKILESLYLSNKRASSNNSTERKSQKLSKNCQIVPSSNSFHQNRAYYRNNANNGNYSCNYNQNFSLNINNSDGKTSVFEDISSKTTYFIPIKPSIYKEKFKIKDKMGLRKRNIIDLDLSSENPLANQKEPLVKSVPHKELMKKPREERFYPAKLKTQILQKESFHMPCKSLVTMGDFIRKKVIYKGNLTESIPKITQSLLGFKGSCLLKHSVLLQDLSIEIRESHELIKRNGKSYLKILLYFMNKMEDPSVLQGKVDFYSKNGLNLWVNNNKKKIGEILIGKNSFIQEILINYFETPYSLLFFDFNCEIKKEVFTRTFALPNTINVFFEAQNRTFEEFITIWKDRKEKSFTMYYSEKLELNGKIVRYKGDFLKFFPFLKENKAGEFWGEVLLSDLNEGFMLKIKVFDGEKKVRFKVLGNNLKTNEENVESFIIETLVFLICKN